MSLLATVLSVLAAYLLVAYGALPMVEARWPAASNTSKLSKAGAVAGLKTAKEFLKLALWVFGVSAILLALLSTIAPVLAGSTLQWLHDQAAWLEKISGGVRSVFSTITLWIAFAALIYVAWRARRGELTTALEDERQSQFEVLLKRATKGELEELPPSAEMQAAISEYEIWSARREEFAASGATGDLLRQIDEVQQQLGHRIVALDLDRRIDLTSVPIFDPKSRNWRDQVKVAIFSKGMRSAVSGISKNIARLATVLACLLTVGVATPALAGMGLIPALERLADVQVLRNETAAAEALKKMVRQPARQEAALADDGDEDNAVYARTARLFVQSLVESRSWETGARRSAPFIEVPNRVVGDVFEEAAVRESIQQLGTSGRAPQREIAALQLRPAFSDDGPALERYASFREHSVTGSTRRALDEAAASVEKWLRAAARTSPPFREKLRAGMASFRQPAPMWDFAGDLLGETLSSAIKQALPDPAGAGLFEKPIGRSGRKSLQTAAERLVQRKFVDFVQGLAGSQSYEQALAAVRSGGDALVFRQGEAREVGNLLSSVEKDRLAVSDALNVNPPSLSERVAAVDRRATEKFAGAGRPVRTAMNSTQFRQAYEGSLGTYDDIFAPQSPTFPGERPAGGGGGGGDGAKGAKHAATRVGSGAPSRASRSFAALRGSFRVGGVLIGTSPRTGQLDYRDLTWRREGNQLTLSLIDKAGRPLAIGTFPAAMVQQALLYAADGRLTTVTMTESPLTAGLLRVHVHPALANTALGRSLIELDRFVDASSSGWVERVVLERRVAGQLAAYNAAFGAATGEPFDDAMTSDMREGSDYLFPLGWDQPGRSFFANYPHRFDAALVSALVRCRAEGGGDAGIGACVSAQSVDAGKFADQPGTIWSGVREREFSLTPAALLASSELPLRFMLQTAFARPVNVDSCTDDACVEAAQDKPWEFTPIAGQVEQRALTYAANDAQSQQILDEAARFTRLQRVFRAALEGKLGRAFARPRLVELMRAAQGLEPVAFRPTPRWHASLSCAIAGRAQLGMALDAASPGAERDRIALAAAYMDELISQGSEARFARTGSCS
jgi:hypothetical protein